MTKYFDVICIGAALVDMVAQVERYPENDDEVYVSDLKLLSGGAAANTAYACAKLGLKTAFIGKLGRDDVFGLKIIKDFNEVKVNTKLLIYSNEYRTGSAYVALNKKEIEESMLTVVLQIIFQKKTSEKMNFPSQKSYF